MQRTPVSAPTHRFTRRRWLGGLCALACMPTWVSAAIKEVRVLVSVDNASVRALLQAIRQRHASAPAETDIAQLDLRRPGVLVAVGPAALRKAMQADQRQPIVSVMVSSQAYRRQMQSVTHEGPSSTAIYAEAAPAAQMQLIAALFERRVSVGVLLSDASAYMERPLRQAAQAAGLDLQLIVTEFGQDPVRALSALPSVQALLIVPDGTLYTPDALRAVLESTYRRGLPTIGFSPATVNAGTLACAHAEPEDVAAELLDLIDGLPPGGLPLPEARHPRYWRVAVNENVARSLGIAISDRVRTLGVRPPGRTP